MTSDSKGMGMKLTDNEHVYQGSTFRRWTVADCRSCGSNAGPHRRKFGSTCPSSTCTFQNPISICYN